MIRSTFTKPRKRMKQTGRRTNAWTACRARLKRKFLLMGIVRCELNYLGCAFDNLLGFAHGKKRRHLEDDELETSVILACNYCHDQIERLPAAEMLAVVEKTIREREEWIEYERAERATEEAWEEYCDGKAVNSQYNY